MEGRKRGGGCLNREVSLESVHVMEVGEFNAFLSVILKS